MLSLALAVVGLVVGVVGVVATIVTAKGHKNRRNAARGEAYEAADQDEVVVETTNRFPVYDQPDGRQSLGDHHIGVVVRNRGARRLLVRSWGLRLGGMGNLVMTRQQVWDPGLPYWLEPGEDATWDLLASEVRRVASEREVAFDDIRAWVSLGDGRTIESAKGVPLR